MPKVKFLQDFQGRETKEAFYHKDEVVEIADELVDRLLEAGRVELVPSVAFASEPQFENAYFGSQPEAEPRQDDVKFEKQVKRGRK